MSSPRKRSLESSETSSSSLHTLQPTTTPPPPYSTNNSKAATEQPLEQRRTIRFEISKPPTIPTSVSDTGIGKISSTTSKKIVAKRVGKATWRVTKAVAGGALGCLCFLFAKGCILDGGGAVGGGKVAVTARSDGGRPKYKPRSGVRLCEEDMTARNTARNSARPPQSRAPHGTTVGLSSTPSRNRQSHGLKPYREHVEYVRSASRR